MEPGRGFPSQEVTLEELSPPSQRSKMKEMQVRVSSRISEALSSRPERAGLGAQEGLVTFEQSLLIITDEKGEEVLGAQGPPKPQTAASCPSHSSVSCASCVSCASLAPPASVSPRPFLHVPLLPAPSCHLLSLSDSL